MGKAVSLGFARWRASWPTVNPAGLRPTRSERPQRAQASEQEEGLQRMTSNPSIFANAIGRNHEQANSRQPPDL